MKKHKFDIGFIIVMIALSVMILLSNHLKVQSNKDLIKHIESYIKVQEKVIKSNKGVIDTFEKYE